MGDKVKGSKQLVNVVMIDKRKMLEKRLNQNGMQPVVLL